MLWWFLGVYLMTQVGEEGGNWQGRLAFMYWHEKFPVFHCHETPGDGKS